MQRYSWIPVALVAALSFGAFAYTATNLTKSEVTSGWQSYCPLSVRHEWTEGSGTYSVRALPGPNNAAPGSSYLFLRDGQLVQRDLASLRQWTIKGDEIEQAPCAKFHGAGATFSLTQNATRIEACYESACSGVAIYPGTWPYAYAEAHGSVVAVTNYGEALLFRNGQWCRMTKEGEAFSCTSPDAPILAEPRGQQFYTSTRYRGRTLLGEWPTGRIYQFDGEALSPFEHQPPFVSNEPVGYEAQAMASYCGDLFVGYWPQGEIWRMDRNTFRWSFFTRLFDNPEGTSFIPYADRPKDGLDPAYFGQRITALVPHGDSLYVATSNLREWDDAAHTPMLTQAQRKQYGRLYEIHREGCRSAPA